MGKSFIGSVISNIDKKTIAVLVETRLVNKYRKIIKSKKKYLVHSDSDIVFKKGDIVSFIETRPFSKKKRWCIVGN